MTSLKLSRLSPPPDPAVRPTDARPESVGPVVRPLVERLVRLGYAAKGLVYVTMGVLAALAAAGTGSGATGARGAMFAIVGGAFGRTLLGTVAAGLGAYVLWQLFRAVLDPEHHDPPLGVRSLARRAEYLVSAGIHIGLTAAAIKLTLGHGMEDEEELARSWTAALMSWPGGRWAVAAVGAVVAGYGIQQIVKGWRSDLDRQLSLWRMGDRLHKLTRLFSRFGLAARGVVFLLVGGFLIYAAWQEDAAETRGLGGALRTIQRQPFGPWMLAAVALGLIAFGLYLFVRAKYRRIDMDAH